MLLCELIDVGARTKSSEIERAEAKVAQAKDELKMLMKHAGSVFQSGIKPEYKTRVDRARIALQVAQDELNHAKAKDGIVSGLRAGQAKVADAQAAYTPEVRSREHGAAISKGFDVWASLRDTHGGDEGLDKAIHAAALKQTEEGTYDLDVAQLAQKFDVPPRSMYKRLEAPSLFQTAMLMPKNK